LAQAVEAPGPLCPLCARVAVRSAGGNHGRGAGRRVKASMPSAPEIR